MIIIIIIILLWVGVAIPPSIAIYRHIRSPEPKSSPPLTRNKWGSCWDRSRVASHEVDAEDVAGTDEWDPRENNKELWES